MRRTTLAFSIATLALCVLALTGCGSRSVLDRIPANKTSAETTPTTTMPKLVGLEKSAALMAVSEAKLKIGSLTESYDTSVAAGRIVSQLPVADSKLFEGAGIAIVVSLGPDVRKVPGVLGASKDLATKKLEAAGFHVVVKSQVGGKAGTVVSQSSASGTSKDGTVTIVISDGSKTQDGDPVQPQPAPKPAPAKIAGTISVWIADLSRKTAGQRTGDVEVRGVDGSVLIAHCPFPKLESGDKVWVTQQDDGAWVVSGPR